MLSNQIKYEMAEGKMLRHRELWVGIDNLARKHGYSPSGLARAAGLDPTSFNKSKRRSPGGRDRWPSTESLTKILNVTGVTLAQFVEFVGKSAGYIGFREYSAIRLSQASKQSAFTNDGLPAGKIWNAIFAPEFGNSDAFAIKIVNNDYNPVYAKGAILIIFPHKKIKSGDRVFLRMVNNSCIIGETIKKNRSKIAVKQFINTKRRVTLLNTEIQFAHKIEWTLQ